MAPVTNQFQALVAGYLYGVMMKGQSLGFDVDLEQPLDADGNYLPYFFVTGHHSGTKLCVDVSVLEVEVHT